MSGSNNPEFLDESSAQAFAEAMISNEEPTDVDKAPLPEDGDQPVQPVNWGLGMEGTDV